MPDLAPSGGKKMDEISATGGHRLFMVFSFMLVSVKIGHGQSLRNQLPHPEEPPEVRIQPRGSIDHAGQREERKGREEG